MAGAMADGSAEFLSQYVKGRAVSCPHYPKCPKKKDPLTGEIFTEDDPQFPSRLGFFHHSQSEPRVSYLETNKVCLECLRQAVPNGYNFWSITVDAKDKPNPSSPSPLEVAPLSSVNSAPLVQAGTEGFHPDSATSLPGATPIIVPIPDVPRAKEAWQWLQDERKPFYIDQLHLVKSRKLTVSGKKAVNADANIVSKHGVPFDEALLVKAAAEKASCRKRRGEASASKSSKSSSSISTSQSHQSHGTASILLSQASESTVYSEQQSVGNVSSMSPGTPSTPMTIEFDSTSSLVKVSEKKKKYSKKAASIQDVEGSSTSVSLSETANQSTADPNTKEEKKLLSTGLGRSGASRKKSPSISIASPVEVSAIAECDVQGGKEDISSKLKKAATLPLEQASSSSPTALDDSTKAEDLTENSTKVQIPTKEKDSKKKKDSSKVKGSTKAKAPTKLKDTKDSPTLGSIKLDADFVVSKDDAGAKPTKPEPLPLQETSSSSTTVALVSTPQPQQAPTAEGLGIVGLTKPTQHSTSVVTTLVQPAGTHITGQDTPESLALPVPPTSSSPKTPKSLLLFESLIKKKSKPNSPKPSTRPMYTRNCYWSQHAPIHFDTQVSFEVSLETKKHRKKSRDKAVFDSSDSEDETSKKEKKAKKKDKREPKEEKEAKGEKKDSSATKAEKKAKDDKMTKENKLPGKATFTGSHKSAPIKAEKPIKPHVDHGTATTSKPPKSSSKSPHASGGGGKGGSGSSSKSRGFNIGFSHDSKSSKSKQSSKNLNHSKDSKKHHKDSDSSSSSDDEKSKRNKEKKGPKDSDGKDKDKEETKEPEKPSVDVDAMVNAQGPEKSAPAEEEPKVPEASNKEDASPPSSDSESQKGKEEENDPKDSREADDQKQKMDSEMPDKASLEVNAEVKAELNAGLDTPVPAREHDKPSCTPEYHKLPDIPDKDDPSPPNLGAETEQPKPDAPDAAAAVEAKAQVSSTVDAKEPGKPAPTKEEPNPSYVPDKKDPSPPDAGTKDEQAKPETEDAQKPKPGDAGVSGEPKSSPLPPPPGAESAPAKAEKPRAGVPPAPEPTNSNAPSAPISSAPIPAGPVPSAPVPPPPSAGDSTRWQDTRAPAEGQAPVLAPQISVAFPPVPSGLASNDVPREMKADPDQLPPTPSESSSSDEEHEPEEPGIQGAAEGPSSSSDSDSDHEIDRKSGASSPDLAEPVLDRMDSSDDDEKEEVAASPSHSVQTSRRNSVSSRDGDNVDLKSSSSSEAGDHPEAADHDDDIGMDDGKNRSTSDEDDAMNGNGIDHPTDDEQDGRGSSSSSSSSDTEIDDTPNPSEPEDQDEESNNEDDDQQSSSDSNSDNDTEEDNESDTDAESSDKDENSDNDPSDAESESNQSSNNSDGDDESVEGESAQSSSEDEPQSEPDPSSAEPSENDGTVSDGGYSS